MVERLAVLLIMPSELESDDENALLVAVLAQKSVLVSELEVFATLVAASI